MPNKLSISQKNRVDFNCSNLSWGGVSQGTFKLVSLINYGEKDNDKNLHVLGLSQIVMAGNMYAKKNLLKQPPYLFQVAGSLQKQIIFRSYISDDIKNNQINDSYGNPLFEDFDLNIIQKKGISISTFEEINTNFIKNQFSAKVIIHINNQRTFIEFPINHININSNSKHWQVETGPILFPVKRKKESLFNYLPCFIHFNNFKTMDVFFDYPFGLRGIESKNKGILKSIPCKIELFA